MQLEHAFGPEGLARLKDYDCRFAFYSRSSKERSVALILTSQGISTQSMKIQTLREELKSEKVSISLNPAPTDEAEKRLEVLMSQLAEDLAQYGGQNNFQPLGCEEVVLSFVISALLLVGMCIFLVLLLTLLSYFDTSYNPRKAAVPGVCFCSIVFPRVIDTDE
ncbi:hypothetical protein J7T55_012232 [Diaporthe amygdali]|uniref:uncharacterized protein n=1 Tax=Phomopsis amygdali TaxID=1214568 RepID=UPI0022FF054F|nr:uncharacterized protein J7T55_012232 [Diaporthe amygdali]KAJ0123763.1 hypothetical protein J7T55_012232 [Diaporthe amygdali]